MVILVSQETTAYVESDSRRKPTLVFIDSYGNRSLRIATFIYDSCQTRLALDRMITFIHQSRCKNRRMTLPSPMRPLNMFPLVNYEILVIDDKMGENAF